MLKALFHWLDFHPQSYWFGVSAATLLLLWQFYTTACAEAKLPLRRPGWGTGIDALILFIFLFTWRWPFLLAASDFNPDESQIIAGAITLTHDPVFWRSVDGTTSGPLNFYALLPIHWLGAPLDYFTARLLGLILIGGGLFACQRAIARLYNRTVAWLAVLPALGFFATVSHPDLVHYSSEHLPLLMVGLSLWLLARRLPEERPRLWLACLIAGATPWSKLQTVPLSLVVLGWAFWQVWRESEKSSRGRALMGAGLAAAVPSLIAVCLIIITGQADPAVRRYVFQNLFYVSSTRPMADALRVMTNMATIDGRFPLLLITGAALLAAGLGFLAIRRVRPSTATVVGGALTFSAVLGILAPRREFLHYVLLLPVPLTFLLGTVIGETLQGLETVRGRLFVIVGLLITGGLLPLITRAMQPVPAIYGQFAYNWREPRSRTGELVHALSPSDSSLGIWGWGCNLYVETGLRQATRDPHTPWSIVPNKQRDYHRAYYLADLRLNRPAVFVDAVGIGGFAFESRLTQAHEIFPELNNFIRDNYTLVTDLGDARVYARSDLDVLKTLTPARVNEIIARGHPNNGHDNLPPPITPIEQLQLRVIGMRSVTMVMPPTRLEWRLDDDVRQVAVEFGFDPVAYERGKSNGAEFILELTYSQNTRQIYRRLLDPARKSEDRGVQSVLVTLPPFPTGSHLVLRTDPGENGDNAWDWVYLASLQFRHSKDYILDQFPTFKRLPNRVDAANSGLIDEEGEHYLQLHAPSTLTYLLHGNEQQLRFDYGFRRGAYTNGGRTDGAVFRVEIQHPGLPARVLFERYLQPCDHPDDQGRQHLNLHLPGNQNGDSLVLTIDPGPAGNASWDWTYITRLDLK